MSLKPWLLTVPMFLVSGTALAEGPRLFGGHYAPPKCGGSDKAAADRELSEGKAHYNHAKEPGEHHDDPAELAAALAAFEAACAAGNDQALEYRAYALAGMKRYVEAAESLDAFLTVHPMDSLDPSVRTRVSSQQGEILKQVTSLTVDAKPHPVRVMINHHDMGMTPMPDVRLEPGTYDVEVLPDDTGNGSVKRTLTLGAGPRTETFDLDTIEAPKTVDVAPLPKETPSKGFVWTGQRIAGIGIGAVGLVAGVAVGIGFTVAGANINSQIPNDCPSGVNPSTNACNDPTQQAKRDSDRNAVSVDWAIAGVAFGIGVAAAITGVVLFATASNPPTKAGAVRLLPWMAPRLSGLSLVATF